MARLRNTVQKTATQKWTKQILEVWNPTKANQTSTSGLQSTVATLRLSSICLPDWLEWYFATVLDCYVPYRIHPKGRGHREWERRWGRSLSSWSYRSRRHQSNPPPPPHPPGSLCPPPAGSEWRGAGRWLRYPHYLLKSQIAPCFAPAKTHSADLSEQVEYFFNWATPALTH